MFESPTLQLQSELEQRVLTRTSRRVRDLVVEVTAQRVVLRGRVTSYYVKQLAQHGIRELLPRTDVDNSIAVDMGMLTAAAEF